MRGRRNLQRHHPGARLSGFIEVLVAVAIGVVILLAGRWGVRLLATPVPDPDPEEVVEVAIDYRCAACGLRLTVTRAQDEELTPPRHCREEMEEVD